MMQYEESVQKLPMREAVRFKENNTKWTASDLKLHVDAHANALLEHRFKKGDKIALWMEPNQHKVCKNEK
jgi:acyl-coenzyme A synthetase/AMP-(fatty) acid ligase